MKRDFARRDAEYTRRSLDVVVAELGSARAFAAWYCTTVGELTEPDAAYGELIAVSGLIDQALEAAQAAQSAWATPLLGFRATNVLLELHERVQAMNCGADLELPEQKPARGAEL